MIVYLSGPIAGCTAQESRGWRDKIKGLLSTRIKILDPTRHGLNSFEDSAHAMVDADKQDILQCDVVLANPWRDSPGTSMEILFACTQGKRIITVWDPKRGPVHPWIKVHSHEIVPTIYNAITKILHLRSIEEGMKHADQIN